MSSNWPPGTMMVPWSPRLIVSVVVSDSLRTSVSSEAPMSLVSCSAVPPDSSSAVEQPPSTNAAIAAVVTGTSRVLIVILVPSGHSSDGSAVPITLPALLLLGLLTSHVTQTQGTAMRQVQITHSGGATSEVLGTVCHLVRHDLLEHRHCRAHSPHLLADAVELGLLAGIQPRQLVQPCSHPAQQRVVAAEQLGGSGGGRVDLEAEIEMGQQERHDQTRLGDPLAEAAGSLVADAELADRRGAQLLAQTGDGLVRQSPHDRLAGRRDQLEARSGKCARLRPAGRIATDGTGLDRILLIGVLQGGRPFRFGGFGHIVTARHGLLPGRFAKSLPGRAGLLGRSRRDRGGWLAGGRSAALTGNGRTVGPAGGRS